MKTNGLSEEKGGPAKPALGGACSRKVEREKTQLCVEHKIGSWTWNDEVQWHVLLN